MPNLFRWLSTSDAQERGGTFLPITLDQLIEQFSFNGTNYPFLVNSGNQAQPNEEPGGDFMGYVDGVYKRNGVVFTCMAVRQLMFSEARFQYQRFVKGRPGDLYGTPALGILERPWEGATTGDLLKKAITDVDLAGNSYFVRRAGNTLRRLRPDWVEIITGSRTGSEIDAEVVGYRFTPGGPASGQDPVNLPADQVAHFKLYDDPDARYRGISWLSPVIGDILGDSATTSHKNQFFSNGANLGYVVTMDPDGQLTPQQFNEWVSTFKLGHEGAMNAYKTLFLSRGADVKVVGTDLKQLDFKAIQGAGETRICGAARVPPILAGFSEGLDAATYSNYASARRAFADMTLRPMWRAFASCLEGIVDVPGDSRLWYDDRDIPFLQEDLKDEAEIQQIQAATITSLIREGYTPESAVSAVVNNEWTLLDHTGLVSVQLQKPGAEDETTPPALPAPSPNGNGQPALPMSTQ